MEQTNKKLQKKNSQKNRKKNLKKKAKRKQFPSVKEDQKIPAPRCPSCSVKLRRSRHPGLLSWKCSPGRTHQELVHRQSVGSHRVLQGLQQHGQDL